MNSKHLLHGIRLVVCGIAAHAVTAATAGQAPPPQLPELPRKQIENQMRALLRDMGDLKEYIWKVNDDGSIVVKTFGGNQICGTLPKVTIVNHAVDESKLTQLDRAIEVVNHKLALGEDVLLKNGIQAACLTPRRKPGQLPELGRDEIKARLARMVQQFGNLAEYIASADAGGPIVVKTFTHKHSCATLPPPHALNSAVNKERLVTLENALHTINKALQSHSKVALEGQPAECLDAKEAISLRR